MYCAIVDFEKAFDNIWRVALWYKLLLNKINGTMYNFIVNIVLTHVLFIMITSQISFQVKWALDKE